MSEYLFSYNLQFFAQEGPGGEKTEEPTQKKKDDTRKEGKVAKSKEVSSALELVAMFLCLKFFSAKMGNYFIETFKWAYGIIPDFVESNSRVISSIEIRALIIRGVYFLVMCCLPFFLAGVAISIGANMIQFRFKISFDPMKPKLDKMNPLNGFKRMFSKETLFELLKSFLKITVIVAIAYSSVKNESNNLLLLYDFDLFTAIGLIGKIIIDTGLKISLVYLIVGAIDFFYQRYKFNENIKMTKQEIKDEYKNTEGDPQIKGRQKQRMMEASRRRMMQSVPQADVVITNPTHIAVALRYAPDENPAPIIVAKGEDYLAQKIKEKAREHGIEIVENKPLARSLNLYDIGEQIPPELFEPVAQILATLDKFRYAS